MKFKDDYKGGDLSVLTMNLFTRKERQDPKRMTAHRSVQKQPTTGYRIGTSEGVRKPGGWYIVGREAEREKDSVRD